MHLKKQAAVILTRAKKIRKVPYKYRDGTMTVRCSPRKLTSDAEMALCALLVRQTTIAEVARLMGCSIPTVSRAVRAWWWKNSLQKQ